MKLMRLAALAVLIVAASCGDATGPRHQSTDLEMAQQRWKTQNLHTYAFTLQRSCFCATTDPLFVAVVSDTVAGVLDFQTGASLDPQLGQTIDGLFGFIQNAIDHHARLIRAEYDGSKGFPSTIDYDGAAEIADDEIFYRVTDVHPISPQLRRTRLTAR